MKTGALRLVEPTDRAIIAEVFMGLGATADQIARAVRVLQNLEDGIEHARRLNRSTLRLLWLNYLLTVTGVGLAALVPGVWWRNLFV